MKNDAIVGRTDTQTTHRRSHVETTSSEIPASVRTRKDAADSVDHQLVDKTKRQIQSLVGEIGELARSGCSTAEFFEGFLNRTIVALASQGGAVWLDESNTENFTLQYHVNLDNTGLIDNEAAQRKHGLLLHRLQRSGQPELIPAKSSVPGAEEAGNPTDHLLLVSPLTIGNQTVGLVEIFQRNGAGPATQRGYLRFLTQMCDIASNYLQLQKIESFDEQKALWQRLDSFVSSIHQSLDPEQAAYIIANEGRRIIESDRVSVALQSGGRCRIKAVSGLDSIERRSDQIKKLQQLTAAVLKSKESLWYSGDDENLPPQIESRLHNYIDKSHTKMLAIVLMHDTQLAAANETDVAPEQTVGALIIEQLKDSEISVPLKRRVEAVATHSQIALANATEHYGLFLLPLWKSLGKMTRPFRGSRLPKTLLLLGIVAAIAAFFALFPYPFTISSNGQLQPIVQKEVFVNVDGVLHDVYVADNQAVPVKAGTPLAQMTNNELMVQIENLQGQIAQTNEQIRNFERQQASQELNNFDSIMLDGELLKTKAKLISLKNELQIKKNHESQLLVVSPVDGVVINWQVRQNLLMRPVKRGQNLMTVVDPAGGWQLELEIPERRMGHLLNRIAEADEPVQVEFSLVSHPGSAIEGSLEKVDQTLDVYSDDGNSAKAIVRFDNEQISPELLKSGTRIKAKLNCGTRSIGYVWFHELFESAQMAYKYWF